MAVRRAPENDFGSELWHSFRLGLLGGLAGGVARGLYNVPKKDTVKHHALYGGSSVLVNILRQAVGGKLTLGNLIGGILASSIGYTSMQAISNAIVDRIRERTKEETIPLYGLFKKVFKK